MAKVFIIHGSNGSKDSHWYPWLDQQLSDSGCQVVRLQFPIKEQQNIKNWLEKLEPHKEELNESILVGHSLGVPFILNILSDWNISVKASFLISGFIGFLDDSRFDDLNKTFVDREFDWQKIKRNCKHFCIIHSNDDPYVPLAKAEELAEHFGIDVTLVNAGEHFQAQSGFKEFPLLLKKIKEEL